MQDSWVLRLARLLNFMFLWVDRPLNTTVSINSKVQGVCRQRQLPIWNRQHQRELVFRDVSWSWSSPAYNFLNLIILVDYSWWFKWWPFAKVVRAWRWSISVFRMILSWFCFLLRRFPNQWFLTGRRRWEESCLKYRHRIVCEFARKWHEILPFYSWCA